MKRSDATDPVEIVRKEFRHECHPISKIDSCIVEFGAYDAPFSYLRNGRRLKRS
jgi:hypothetical protein